MVNRVITSMGMMAILTLSGVANASVSIGDISSSQQSMLLLKSALERAKLEKELSQMSDTKVSVAEVCATKGIGMLTLKAVYGTNNKLTAAFSYNPLTQIEAKTGDSLLCGEKVKKVSLDKVEVEKDGKIYTVSGTVTALSSSRDNLQPTTSSGLPLNNPLEKPVNNASQE